MSATTEMSIALRARHRFHSWLPGPAEDGLTVALVVLLVGAVLLEGGWAWLGLPSSAEGKLIDLAEGVLCICLLVPIVRERRFGLLLAVSGYIAWVLGGAIYSQAPFSGVTTALRNWLLAPVFGILLATRGTTESRARAVVVALLALGAVELLLAVIQILVLPGAARNNDLIVGSFGSQAQSIMGVVVLLIACLGVAGYLIGARYGVIALVGAVVFPIFSAWGIAKLVTIALPALVLLIATVALVLRHTTWRRALIAFSAAVVSSCLVIAAYAVFFPDAFRTFTSVSNLTNYASTGSVNGGASYSGGAAQLRANLNGTILSSFGNASVVGGRVPAFGTNVFRVGNLSAGKFAAYLQTSSGALIRAQPEHVYEFSTEVASATAASLTIQLRIQWRDAHRRPVSTDVPGAVRLPGDTVPLPERVRKLSLAVTAPPRAVYAIPYLQALGSLPKGASFYVTRVRFLSGEAPIQAALHGTVVRSFANASVVASYRQRGKALFLVRSLTAGAFAAYLEGAQGESSARGMLRAKAQRWYAFSLSLSAATGAPLLAQARIQWRDGKGRPFRTDMASRIRLTGGASSSSGQVGLAYLGASAPRGAVYAVPYVEMVGAPAVGATIAIHSITFRPARGTRPSGNQSIRHETPHPKHSTKVTSSRPSRTATSPSHMPMSGSAQTSTGGFALGSDAAIKRTSQVAMPELPGHLTLLRMSARAIAGGIGSELFGQGAGSAGTAARAAAGGGSQNPLPDDAAAGSYSDAGTLTVERGWSGVLLAVLAGLALVFAAVRVLRNLPAGRWATAFTLTIPGAAVVMGAYGLVSTGFQAHASALMFWVIVAIGLAPALRNPTLIHPKRSGD